MWLAINHHRTHKNKAITFDKHYYLRDLYLDQSDHINVIKATQSGISEWLVTIAIGESSNGRSIFYVLPTDQLKNRFVQNRFDRSVNFTLYYQQLLKESNNPKSAESVSLKHLGMGAIAFVGSNTPNPFTEYPADTLIVDEFDRCDQENVTMGEERLSASDSPRRIYVSNPTVPNYGIDLIHNESDQKVWMIKHDCGHYFSPDWWNNVVEEIEKGIYIPRDHKWTRESTRDIYPICQKCGKPYDRFFEGEWVETKKSYKSGYRISKLFSTSMTMIELFDRFYGGLISSYKMQRFYNGDLGLAYTAAGTQITEEMLDDCVCDYNFMQSSDVPTIAGIDVGTLYNIIIARPGEKLHVVCIAELQDTQDVIELLYRYKVKCFVIDAQPEKREARRIVVVSGLRSKAVGFVAYFTNSRNDLMADPYKLIVTADRTYCLDNVKEDIFMQKVELPTGARYIPNFYDQMTASTRVYDEKKERYDWVHGTREDHYFLAFTYMVMANRIIASTGARQC